MAGLESAHMALEKSQARLLDAIAKLTEQNAIVADHERRISALELSAVERVVARAESAQAWRAVEAIAGEMSEQRESEKQTKHIEE